MNWFFKQLGYKVQGIFLRFLRWFRWLPIRLLRLFKHSIRPKRPIGHWLIEWLILLLEIIGIGELFESLNDLLKFNSRPLTKEEIKTAQIVYGNSIDYSLIRIDEYAYCGCKQYYFAYVSFSTINYWGKMTNSHLIHELIHVWQYHQIGAIYMHRAIRAQYTKEGYDYGGIPDLTRNSKQGIWAFNLEQQGDIASDYYRLLHKERPNWGMASFKDLPLYQIYIDEIKSSV